MKKNKVRKQATRMICRAFLKIGKKSNDISKDKKEMTIYIEYFICNLVTYFPIPTNYKN